MRLRLSFLAAAPRSVRSDDAMITGCATRSAATSLQLLALQTRNKPVIHTIVHVADVVVLFISGLQFVTTLERRSEQSLIPSLASSTGIFTLSIRLPTRTRL